MEAVYNLFLLSWNSLIISLIIIINFIIIGVYSFSNGERYDGKYKEGKRSGKVKDKWLPVFIYEINNNIRENMNIKMVIFLMELGQTMWDAMDLGN